jgi:hypothetical protein
MHILLTHSENGDDLLEYYLIVSARTKGISEGIIFQWEVDAAVEVLGLVPFQVTYSQVTTTKSFDFCGPSYSDIGTSIIPFSATPSDAMSNQGSAAIMADRCRPETYDLSGKAVNGAIITMDATCLRNLKGYASRDWMEAHMQIQSMAVMMGAFLGTTHSVLECYTTSRASTMPWNPRCIGNLSWYMAHGWGHHSWCSTCSCSDAVG